MDSYNPIYFLFPSTISQDTIQNSMSFIAAICAIAAVIFISDDN
jgi:hypothetical protein